MCNNVCVEFGQTHLTGDRINGKAVIEVGSLNVNGSIRSVVEPFQPRSYLGVDLELGPGVDQVYDAMDLLDRFGFEAFDLLISTELLEHVRDWRTVISNFKRILKPNGTLFITTRSQGFEYHGYPFDYWRYEIHDMQAIFF